MNELKDAILKELVTVYKAATVASNAYEEACLHSGAASLEWILDKMKELDEKAKST